MYRIYHEYNGKRLSCDIRSDGRTAYEDAKYIAKDKVQTFGGKAWVIDASGETKYIATKYIAETIIRESEYK